MIRWAVEVGCQGGLPGPSGLSGLVWANYLGADVGGGIAGGLADWRAGGLAGWQAGQAGSAVQVQVQVQV